MINEETKKLMDAVGGFIIRYENYKGRKIDGKHTYVIEHVEDLKPGDRISIHNNSKYIHDVRTCSMDDDILPTDIFFSRLLRVGDYVGSAVEASNYRVFLKEHVADAGVFDAYGGFGFCGIGIVVRNILDFKEELEELAGYPVLDEEDWINEEEEGKATAWEDNYCEEFCEAVCKMFPNYAEYFQCTKVSDKIADGKFYYIAEQMDALSYWINEDGNTWYLDIDRMLKDVTEEDMEVYVNTYLK